MAKIDQSVSDFRPSVALTHALATSDEDLPLSMKPKPLAGDPTPSQPESKSICSRLARIWRIFEKRPTLDTSSFESLPFAPPIKRKPCRMTFIFDPAGRFYYFWTMIVSVTFAYNLWIISYRYAFDEITSDTVVFWFTLDYTADLIYLLDLLISFRTGYLKDGVLQTNLVKIRFFYTNSTYFYLDCLSLLPLEFLYLSIGFVSAVRSVRLVKIYKYWAFLDSLERHTNSPTLCRGCILLHRLCLIFHWNACIVYLLRDTLLIPKAVWNQNDHFYNYVASISIGCRLLFTTQPSEIYRFLTVMNETESESDHLLIDKRLGSHGLILLLIENIAGILLLALIIGNMTNMVSHRSSARKEFQSKTVSMVSCFYSWST